MQCERLIYSDTTQIGDLQPDGWGNIVSQFEFYAGSEFCFPIKLMIDHQIVGVGSTIVHNDVAWLAHIIVHRDYRCKGLGRLITQILIDQAKKNLCSTIYLTATDLGEPIYRKEGFVSETEYLIYKNVAKKDWVISDHIHPYEEKYKSHFTAFDKYISGEERMMHLESYLADSLMFCHDGNIEGYYLPTFGEGLILATSEYAGIELLKMHLKNNDNVAILKENLSAREFLNDTGFGELKTIKRMRLGNERTVRFKNIYNRVGGKIG